jgi:hypothetical protein
VSADFTIRASEEEKSSFTHFNSSSPEVIITYAAEQKHRPTKSIRLQISIEDEAANSRRLDSVRLPITDCLALKKILCRAFI